MRVTQTFLSDRESDVIERLDGDWNSGKTKTCYRTGSCLNDDRIGVVSNLG